MYSVLSSADTANAKNKNQVTGMKTSPDKISIRFSALYAPYENLFQLSRMKIGMF